MFSQEQHRNYIYTSVRYEPDISHFLLFFVDEVRNQAGQHMFSDLLNPAYVPPPQNPPNQNAAFQAHQARVKEHIKKNKLFLAVLTEMTNKTAISDDRTFRRHIQESNPRLAFEYLRTATFQRQGGDLFPIRDAVDKFLKEYTFTPRESLYEDMQHAANLIEEAALQLNSLPAPHQYAMSEREKQLHLRRILNRCPRFFPIFKGIQCNAQEFTPLKDQLKVAIESHKSALQHEATATVTESAQQHANNEVDQVANAAAKPNNLHSSTNPNHPPRSSNWKSRSPTPAPQESRSNYRDNRKRSNSADSTGYNQKRYSYDRRSSRSSSPNRDRDRNYHRDDRDYHRSYSPGRFHRSSSRDRYRDYRNHDDRYRRSGSRDSQRSYNSRGEQRSYRDHHQDDRGRDNRHYANVSSSAQPPIQFIFQGATPSTPLLSSSHPSSNPPPAPATAFSAHTHSVFGKQAGPK